MQRETRTGWIARGLVALLALVLVGLGGTGLYRTADGLTVEPITVGAIPATVYRPAGAPPGPVVVIAHGFAGSQQLMQPFAVTLARRGYTAVTFDFPGHGRHPDPLPGGIEDYEALERALFDALAAVAEAARSRAGPATGHALVGHSMAADAVVRFALSREGVDATVAISLFFNTVEADRPRNLQVVYGAFEPEPLIRQGRDLVAAAVPAGGPVEEGVTYGALADGTARRLVLADGVEHIGVLYSAESLTATADWLDGAFGRTAVAGADVDRRGGDLGLLFVGLVALAWPLAALLPRVTGAAGPVGRRLGWRPLLAVTGAAAMATPVVLWPVPSDFLPILLGDYLALHFGLYGLIVAGGLSWLARRGHPIGGARAIRPGPVLLVLVAAGGYATLVIGWPVDRFVANLQPVPARWGLIAALFAGTLLFFATDAALTDPRAAPRFAYPATKAGFLVSLAIAIALDLERLFFLIIIVPAILVLFVAYGLIAAWVTRATGSPMVAAVVNALVFAWAIAVVFPMAGG